MLVKSIEVPDVEATAVPLVKGYSIPVDPATVLDPVIAPVTPSVLVNVPVVPDTAPVNVPVVPDTAPVNVPVVPDTAPVALRVPVIATPVEETAATVTPPLCRFKFPVASEVTITPPPPAVLAFIRLAIYISPLIFTGLPSESR
jgi:hypothetical protein